MNYEPSNQYISYKYVEADSPKKLEMLMLQIQVTAKKPVNFTPPIYNNKINKYETWYQYDFSKDIKPKEKLELNNKVKI